jgi:DNA-binding PadR family transcriptional regulator
MSADGKFEKGPNYFMVLDAISRDINSEEKIAKSTKLNKEEVQLILDDLLNKRLIVKVEKKKKSGFIFAKKKIEMAITDIGMKLLNAKKQELEQQKQQMQQYYESGDNNQLQSYMDANKLWMPMMLFSGIMDMMFFNSMMSFMGMGMNPMESAMIADIGNGFYQQQDVSSSDSSNDDVDTNSNDDGTSSSGDYDNSISNDSSNDTSSGYDYNDTFDSFDFGSGGYDSF